MKRIIVAGIAVFLMSGCIKKVEKNPDAIDEKKAAAASEQIIADYQAALKRELVSAMTSGGPENAIAVCNVVAPAIADSFTLLAGVDIRRVSLKQRNPHFVPDSFEVTVLEYFNAAARPEPLIFSELSTDDGGIKRFRYLKEIKVGQLCLKCHGNPQGFSANLLAILTEKYPRDMATGYNVGDSRGAFSVTLTYPEAEASVTEILSENGK